MTIAQAMLWSGAGGGAAIAVLAGWRERRRKRRDDPDAVGLLDWPTIQVLALLGMAICGWLALQ